MFLQKLGVRDEGQGPKFSRPASNVELFSKKLVDSLDLQGFSSDCKLSARRRERQTLTRRWSLAEESYSLI